MRSPVSRVAAVAIFVFAITGFAMLFQGGGGVALAFDDFAAPILEAKTVRYKMTIELKGPPMQTLISEVMLLDGARMRQETELPDESKVVVIQDLSQGKSLTLLPATKTATLYTPTGNRKDKTREYGVVFFRLFQLVAENKPGIEHKSLGEKEIDGRKVVGFRISSQPHDLILWGDPETSLPVRVEMTSGIEGSMKAKLSDFAFNADVDESLFSLEPPADYKVTVRNVQPDASPPEEGDLIAMFREYSSLCDGSFPDSLDPLTTTTIVGKKASIQMVSQNLWDELAPAKGKPTDVQKRELEELMLKVIEGKLSKEQISEQVEEFIETHGLKTAERGETQAQETEASGQDRVNEIMRRVQRGLEFAIKLPPDAEGHYVGKGVSLGAVDTPIFWYRPKDAKNYRVIYADLSVSDSETPPNVTN